MSRTRSIPWRFVLPSVIFPYSLWSWVQYNLSVRAHDDSPAPWYWYGGLLSACLNSPAYFFSAPFQRLIRFTFQIGRLSVEPRIVAFFVIVPAFWFWIGMKLESRSNTRDSTVSRRPTVFAVVLLGLAAALWILWTIGTVLDAVNWIWNYWSVAVHVDWDADIMRAAALAWCVVLAPYYTKQLVSGIRARRHIVQH